MLQCWLLAAATLCAAPATAQQSRAVAADPGESPTEAEEIATAMTLWPAGSLGRQVRDDFKRLFSRPFRLRGREWILPGALAAGTGVAYALRDKVREEFQEHRSESRDDFLQDVRVTGKGAFVPALAGVLALVGPARGSAREKQTALLLIESFVGSAVYSAAGSTLLAAERPEDGDSVHFLDTDGHGVSLDTALAASMIAPLDRAYFRPRPGEARGRRFWRRIGRGLLYLVPALVAAQRINQDKHWLPDVYLGYTTGLLVGRALEAPYAEQRIEVRPSGAGVRLRF